MKLGETFFEFITGADPTIHKMIVRDDLTHKSNLFVGTFKTPPTESFGRLLRQWLRDEALPEFRTKEDLSNISLRIRGRIPNHSGYKWPAVSKDLKLDSALAFDVYILTRTT